MEHSLDAVQDDALKKQLISIMDEYQKNKRFREDYNHQSLALLPFYYSL